MISDLPDRATQLSVQQIQTFCAVIECGGYAEAARRLNQTTTTLWEQMKVLQRIYGGKLLQRRGRGVEATEAGSALYRQLQPLLETIGSTFRVLEERATGVPSQIRLVTGVRMMLEELGKAFQSFTRRHPNLRLKLRTADDETAQQMVSDSECDVALMIEPSRDALLPGLTVRRLYAIEHMALLPNRHALTQKRTVRVADLLSSPLILGNVHSIGRRQFDQCVYRLGRQADVHVVAETDTSAVTIACVRAGMGIGVIAGRPDGNLVKSMKTRSLAKEMGVIHVVACTRDGWIPTGSDQDLFDTIIASAD